VRSMRGLHVIRGGVGVPRLATTQTRAEIGRDEPTSDGRLGTLDVEFSRFDTWYRIDSAWEGTFLERTMPGAFRRTIKNNRDQVKVMFNHGMEFNEGSKLLGPIETLEEREDGPYMQVKLLDAPFARDLEPGLREGLYGSSFMFEVVNDHWDDNPERSEHNPDGLPERSITEVRLHEAGPVTWPANPAATSALRSGTDWYAAQVRQQDDARYEDLKRSFTAFRAMHGLRTPTTGPADDEQKPEPKTSAPGTEPARHVDGMSAAARKRRLTLIDMAR